jgi:hypothetical protein
LKGLSLPVEAGAAAGPLAGAFRPIVWMWGPLREPRLGDRYPSVLLHLAGSFPQKPPHVSPSEVHWDKGGRGGCRVGPCGCPPGWLT